VDSASLFSVRVQCKSAALTAVCNFVRLYVAHLFNASHCVRILDIVLFINTVVFYYTVSQNSSHR